MKKFLKLIAVATAFAASAVSLTAPVGAYELFGPYKLIGDLSETTVFFYGDSFAQQYASKTMLGAMSWIGCPDVELYWTHVTTPTTYTVKVDFGDLASHVIASTSFYYHHSQYNNTEYEPNEHNWDNCTIWLNESLNISYTTMIHEFGHVYGLAHSNDDPTSIMCQTAYGRTATAPSADDFAGIAFIYNNN